MQEELVFQTRSFIYSPLNKKVTILIQDQNGPCMLIAIFNALVLKNKVKMCRFESNSAGGRIAEKVQNDVKKQRILILSINILIAFRFSLSFFFDNVFVLY